MTITEATARELMLTELTEEWRPFPDATGYLISNIGNVRSLWRRGACLSMVLGNEPRDIRPRVSRYGYRSISIRKNGRSITKRIARAVLEAFVGPPPGQGMQACHQDGRHGNDRTDNLRWDTPKGNDADKDRHGTRPRGVRHGRARLCDADVLRIRILARNGVALYEIAAMYGVDRSTVGLAVAGKTWKHINDAAIAAAERELSESERGGT